jgi:ribose/xylose/arabinose/galactoside ABC-type transport system permease subunit
MLGISTFYQYVMKGIILIVAVAITSAQGLFATHLRSQAPLTVQDDVDTT